MCGVGAPGALVTDIEDSRIEQDLPPAVQCACLCWVYDLQKCGAQLNDNNYIHQFLQTHLLHWLEALSWTRKVSATIHAIAYLEPIALVG